MTNDFRPGSIEEAVATVLNLTEGTFYRLPSHVVKNELYVLSKAVPAFYNSLKNGGDLDMKELNSIIAKLTAIKKEAKAFKQGDDVPLMYEAYKGDRTNKGVMYDGKGVKPGITYQRRTKIGSHWTDDQDVKVLKIDRNIVIFKKVALPGKMEYQPERQPIDDFEDSLLTS